MKASVVLVIENDKILAVSRKTDPDSWSLPGGKTEEGETEIVTAAREFVEETGRHVANLRLIGVHQNGEFEVSLFSGELIGDIVPHENEDGCQVNWLEPKAFSKGVFEEYNKAVLENYLNIAA